MPIRNVADAMRELKSGKSKHIKSREQAIAVGLSEQRRHEHHSNPTQYYGNGDTPAVSDGGGPLQAYEATEQMDQFEEGPDEFQMDAGPEVPWPGEKVKQRPRRQAY